MKKRNRICKSRSTAGFSAEEADSNSIGPTWRGGPSANHREKHCCFQLKSILKKNQSDTSTGTFAAARKRPLLLHEMLAFTAEGVNERKRSKRDNNDIQKVLQQRSQEKLSSFQTQKKSKNNEKHVDWKIKDLSLSVSNKIGRHERDILGSNENNLSMKNNHKRNEIQVKNDIDIIDDYVLLSEPLYKSHMYEDETKSRCTHKDTRRNKIMIEADSTFDDIAENSVNKQIGSRRCNNDLKKYVFDDEKREIFTGLKEPLKDKRTQLKIDKSMDCEMMADALVETLLNASAHKHGKQLYDEHENCIQHVPCVGCLDSKANITRIVGFYGEVQLTSSMLQKELSKLLPNKNASCCINNHNHEVQSDGEREEIKTTSSSNVIQHVRCRNLVYYREKDSPEQTVYRVSVPENAIAWDKKFEEYKPPDWTKKSVKECYLDYEINELKDAFWFCFNTVDKASIVKNNTLITFLIDRRSSTGIYKINEIGRPLNPFGRTGLCGRGLLPRWGPNHLIHYVITRWAKARNRLEFISVLSECKQYRILPEIRSDIQIGIPDVVKNAIYTAFQRQLNELELPVAVKNEIDNFLNVKNSVTVYNGYLDDSRNTDNAWVETSVISFHDDSGCLLNSVTFDKYDDCVKWETLTGSLKTFPSHKDILNLVALRMKAEWSD